ncbi:TonB-dependent receptor plug domain-containing protein [Prosthecobacter vanneervenii]|uniref:Vitamin B12 transporter n=1 Tax=Prosthecobacter vanneervenii TaxID=48466 RepID=A0A7W7Y9C8_9BACT|nr:TonB-dependent receptor [Prosthecobacter vanneervenii]MBB5031827.1 vitamin B12 transporter [Prosthecobacter vanneervenii]
MYLQKTSGRRPCAAITAALLAAIQLSAAETPAQPQTKKQTQPQKQTQQKPAAPASTAAADIPEVVITATMTDTESWRTASSVTVIDRKKIEENQYRFAVDALRNVPGMAIATPGVPGNVATVMTRGTTTKDTALMIDGRPLPANLAGSFNLETMALDNVERIEVLRGPAASLYGGRTMGGVINIITRSGKGLEKPRTTVFAETGSYGTIREGISSLGAIGKMDWGFEASRTDMQGQRINSRFSQTNMSGKAGYQFTDSLRFDLDARHYTANAGDPRTTDINDPDNHLLTEFWSISPRLVWNTTSKWTQSLTFSHSQFRQVATGYNDPPFFLPNNRTSSRTDFIEYKSVIQMMDKWTLTAGAWFQDQKISRYNDTAQMIDISQAQTNFALFLQSQAELFKGFNLINGIRYDKYSDFDNAFTWRSGVSYMVPRVNTVLHANYGTAYTPPTPQDLTPVFGGNPALVNPERSRGYEAGIMQPLFKNKLSLRATFFRNDLSNTYQYPPPAFIPMAIGSATTQGLESGLDWNPCAMFGLNLSYTYLDAYDNTNMARLVRRPRHSISGGIRFQPVKDVTFNLNALYVIDREDYDPITFAQIDQKDYLSVRLSANWRVNEHLDLFARVENLLGQPYYEIPGYPVMSTGAYAGLRLRF